MVSAHAIDRAGSIVVIRRFMSHSRRCSGRKARHLQDRVRDAETRLESWQS